MGTKRRRIGRPTKKPKAGERVPLGLRVTAEIKRKLDAAAEDAGRSQSQEAELRLERSFEWEEARGTVQQWMAEACSVVQGDIENAFRHFGYTPISMLPSGRMWASPDADLSTINLAIDAGAVIKEMQPDLVAALTRALGKFAKKDEQS